MRGPRLNVVAISWPQVSAVVPVASSTTEKSASVKADGIEDVDAPAVALPAHERLAEEADRDQQELQDEPVVLEPEEQVGAEDDRERAEAEQVALAPRPRQQHVEGVGEEELPDEQRHVVVDRRPVLAPVGVDARWQQIWM